MTVKYQKFMLAIDKTSEITADGIKEMLTDDPDRTGISEDMLAVEKIRTDQTRKDIDAAGSQARFLIYTVEELA